MATVRMKDNAADREWKSDMLDLGASRKGGTVAGHPFRFRTDPDRSKRGFFCARCGQQMNNADPSCQGNRK